nr:signal peptidase I [Cellulomonas humilata]
MLRRVRDVFFWVAVAACAWLLWPSSVGGCTTLIIVSGHSMEPTYATGDLVVARCGEPAVGDVVVYRPTELGGDARIIHRVIGGDATGWQIQGDNNDWVDPFAPTNDEVIGVAAIHIPKVGLVASAIASPWIWASLIVLAIALLVWPRDEDDEDDEEPAPPVGAMSSRDGSDPVPELDPVAGS